MRFYEPVRWLHYYDTHAILCAWYYTSCCIQQNCQMHFIARSQVSAQDALKHTPEHALKYTPNCTRWHSQPAWLYAPTHTPEYAPKYTSNCTRWLTPSLLDYTLPSKLSRCSQVHSEYTPKYTSVYVLKYTPEPPLKDAPNCSRWHSQPARLYAPKQALKTLSSTLQSTLIRILPIALDDTLLTCLTYTP